MPATSNLRRSRARFVKPRVTLRELFARMVFNILVDNTDDHVALWDGELLALTLAYDICSAAT